LWKEGSLNRIICRFEIKEDIEKGTKMKGAADGGASGG
jgi:hypothetical protein